MPANAAALDPRPGRPGRLARGAAGWVREYPWEPTPVTVNGAIVWPYALIDVESFERGLAYRKPGR